MGFLVIPILLFLIIALIGTIIFIVLLVKKKKKLGYFWLLSIFPIFLIGCFVFIGAIGFFSNKSDRFYIEEEFIKDNVNQQLIVGEWTVDTSTLLGLKKFHNYMVYINITDYEMILNSDGSFSYKGLKNYWPSDDEKNNYFKFKGIWKNELKQYASNIPEKYQTVCLYSDSDTTNPKFTWFLGKSKNEYVLWDNLGDADCGQFVIWRKKN